MLTREQLLTLFKLNTQRLAHPDTRRRLRQGVQSGRDPSEITTEVQREVLGSLGIDPDFGIDCLSRVSTLFQNDREVMTDFFTFVTKEELACEVAEMSEEEMKRKMAHISFMKQQHKHILDDLRHLPPEEQHAYLHKVQVKVQAAQRAAFPTHEMTPDEVLRFFQDEERRRPTPDEDGRGGYD
jgi:hypothetical protein